MPREQEVYRDDLWRAFVLAGRVGRVHGHLWNDGAAHLHMWFIPRPLGYLDLLGSVLVEWEELLPRATEEEVLAAAADLRSRLQDGLARPVA